MFVLGPKADIRGALPDVRFTPESRHRLTELGCPLCAKKCTVLLTGNLEADCDAGL